MLRFNSKSCRFVTSHWVKVCLPLFHREGDDFVHSTELLTLLTVNLAESPTITIEKLLSHLVRQVGNMGCTS